MSTPNRHPFLSPGDQDYVVERDQRLSESLLWGLQGRFYAAQDASLWGSGQLPSYVTCNAWVARATARLLLNLLIDLGREDATRLVTVLEVGAGSGRLAFLVLSELDRLADLCGADLPPYRYVLSDISETSLAAWAEHPAFARWLAQGRLDLARFDLDATPACLSLRGSGTVVDAEHPGGPLIVLASYVLDALAQDAFYVWDGDLYEGQVSLLADHPFADRTDPDILNGLAAVFGWRPLTSSPYYEDAQLDALLGTYRDLLTRGAFGLPLGAVRSLRRLSTLCEGGLFMLSTDKAWSHPQQLEGETAPFVMGHGSASMMVDHHAIGRWVQAQGGLALLTSPREGTVETALFALDVTTDLGLTRMAFETELNALSPADFLGLTEAAQAEQQPALARVLGLLRLGAWDPAWLSALLPAIEARGPTAPRRQQQELQLAVDEVARRVFAVPGETRDMLDEVRRAYVALGGEQP